MSKEKQIELKPCPFCGGKAEIHYQQMHISNSVIIRCVKCGTRSKFIPYDCDYQFYNGEKNVYVSKERAMSDAINLWNRRV